MPETADHEPQKRRGMPAAGAVVPQEPNKIKWKIELRYQSGKSLKEDFPEKSGDG
jgi:hypothetical protein